MILYEQVMASKFSGSNFLELAIEFYTWRVVYVTCKFHFIATMFHIYVKGMVSHIVVLVRLVFLFFHLMICASQQVTSLSIKQILSLNPIF
jgi:hypothetical protein